MLGRSKLILEAMAISAVLATIDIIAAFAALIINSSVQFFEVVTVLLIAEFALLLILGGCMMAREPLDEEKKQDSEGNPVRAWRMALIGRKLLLSALFTFAFSLLFFLFDLIT